MKIALTVVSTRSSIGRVEVTHIVVCGAMYTQYRTIRVMMSHKWLHKELWYGTTISPRRGGVNQSCELSPIGKRTFD